MVGIKEITLHLCLDHSPSAKLRFPCNKIRKQMSTGGQREKREGGQSGLWVRECNVYEKSNWPFRVRPRLRGDERERKAVPEEKCKEVQAKRAATEWRKRKRQS